MTESTESPFFIHIHLKPPRKGDFKLFARFDGNPLPTYPLEFHIYSTIPSAEKTVLDTYVADPERFEHQICSKVLTYNVTIRDETGEPTTFTSV